MASRTWLAVTADGRVRYMTTAAHDDGEKIAAMPPPEVPQVWVVPDRGDGLAELRGIGPVDGKLVERVKAVGVPERLANLAADAIVQFVEVQAGDDGIRLGLESVCRDRSLAHDQKADPDGIVIGDGALTVLPESWEPKGLGYSVRRKALEVRPTRADPTIWEAEQSPGKFAGAFVTQALAEAARPTTQEWWVKTTADPLADPFPAVDELSAHLAADAILRAIGK